MARWLLPGLYQEALSVVGGVHGRSARMSPIEAVIALDLPQPYVDCPKCGQPFSAFMRGQVVRFNWFGLRRKIWCLICYACKEIVGHEVIL